MATLYLRHKPYWRDHMATCQLSPNTPDPKRRSEEPKRQPSAAARSTARRIQELNLHNPDLRISEVARTPEGVKFLQRKLNEDYFVRIAAENAALGTYKASNLGQWIARHFPMLIPDGPLKNTRKFLTSNRLMGEALVDTFTLAGDTLEGTVARVKVTQLFTDGYKRVEKTLKDNGVRLTRDEMQRLWIDAIELGRSPVLLRQLSDGAITERARAYLLKQHDKFVKRLGDLGLGEETRKLLLREAEDINNAFEDLHTVADLAGLDYGDVTLGGIGYMPRVFSSDFKFRLRRLDEGVEKAFAYDDPVRAVNSALRKSRQSYDLIVEDELMLAATLGLVKEAEVKRLRRLLKNAPDKVSTTRSELLGALDTELEGLTFRHNKNRELLEKKLTTKAAAAEQAYAAAHAEAPKKRNPQAHLDAARAKLDKVYASNADTLQKMTTKHEEELTKYYAKRNEQLSGFDEYGGADKAQARLHDLLVESTDELARYINEDGALITELLKLNSDTLDGLIDSGVLSKVPIPTTQLADELIKRYDLPYSGIDELIITDPHQAYQYAKEQTKRAMGKSSVMRGFYREALDNGWGVTSAEVFANPDAYKGWHKLDPDLLLERFGLDKSLNPPTPLYVHPVVEEQLIGVLSVATDPATLSTFARVWQYTWKLAKEQVLTTSGFLGRQVWQLFIQAGMSGTNLARVIPAIGDWVRFGSVGLDAFDDTVKLYANGTMTKRQMVAEAMQRGFLDTHQAVGVGTAVVKSTESASGIDPRHMMKALNKWGAIAKSYGVLPDSKGGWAFVEYGAGLVGRASNDAAAHVMSWGVWLEQAFKLAYLDTVMRTRGLDELAQLMTGNKARFYPDMDSAIKNARDYFLDYSDFGDGDRFIAKNIAPFWMYMSRSVPATVRHVLRHPQQYMTMQRLYHLASQDVRENPRDNPEGGVAPWQQYESGTIYLPHPDNDGRLIHIPLASIDPVADVSNRLNGIADALGTALGVYGPDGSRGFVEEGKTLTGGGGRTGSVLRAMLGQSFGPAKSVLALITKEDPRSGRELLLKPGQPTPTIMGLEVPGGEVSPLAKFLIENTLPVVGNLNRWNPGGVFGRKERTDAAGNVVLPSSPSWLDTARTDSDLNYTPDLSPALQFLKSTGIAVNSIDLAVGMQYTVSDMDRTAREVKTRYGRLYKVITDPNTDEKVRARSEEQAIALAALYVELETGKVSGTQWLNAEGYMSNEQRTKAEQAALRKLESAAKKAKDHDAKVRLLTEALTR